MSSSSAGTGPELVGFWAQHPDDGSRLPWPGDLVDPFWDRAGRDRVADWVGAQPVVAAWRGLSTCRLCGALNGSTDLSDGTWQWPSGLAHYVRDHAVRLGRFEDHVLARLAGLPAAVPDPGACAGCDRSADRHDDAACVWQDPPAELRLERMRARRQVRQG